VQRHPWIHAGQHAAAHVADGEGRADGQVSAQHQHPRAPPRRCSPRRLRSHWSRTTPPDPRKRSLELSLIRLR
jgi:hypothetical protein